MEFISAKSMLNDDALGTVPDVLPPQSTDICGKLLWSLLDVECGQKPICACFLSLQCND